MPMYELRNLEETEQFMVQGLWLQRQAVPAAATVRPVLEWMLELASSSDRLPPVGFVADLGHLMLGSGLGEKVCLEPVPGLPSGLARSYEDQVLGKFYTDWTVERAGDALRRYHGRDRARGLAFIVEQFHTRADYQGVNLSPAVIKALMERPGEEVLAQGWEALSRGGLLPILRALYEDLIARVRRMAEVLAPEDVFELEHGTAVAMFSQRLALRQVLQAAGRLESLLPDHAQRPTSRRHEVPTRILDEDTYPVGGFSSLSNRGSIESLLHSQLAFMEKDDRPDLFDIKFLRGELLYYARDENQFLRRRHTFVLALFADLRQARFKDADLPWQRIVLLLGLLVVLVRRLSDWLRTDALLFEFVFVDESAGETLEQERTLVEMVLREQITNGTVAIIRLPAAKLAARCTERAKRSMCHCLLISALERGIQAEDTILLRLRVDSPVPSLAGGDDALACPLPADRLEGWGSVLQQLLQLLV